MRLHPSCDRRRVALALCVATLVAGTNLPADIGGGSGRVLTPYRAGRPVTAMEIEQVRGFAAKARVVRGLQLKDTNVSGNGENVGLSYVSGSTRPEGVTFEFRGADEQGQAVAVDFSQVDTVSILRFEDNLLAADRVLVEVKVFPDMSVEGLLREQPTYTQLRAGHERTQRLWIPASASGGRELALVASSDEAGYRLLARLRQIEPNRPIEFGWGRFKWNGAQLPAIWWAIESVTKDEKYPHRVIQRA